MQVFEYVILHRVRDKEARIREVVLLDGKIHLCLADHWTEVIRHAVKDVLANHPFAEVQEIELIVRPFQAVEGSAGIYHKCNAKTNWFWCTT